jgi:glycosyltransferase involved in cell wall biosynthesis
VSRAAGASGSQAYPGRVRVLILDDSAKYIAKEPAIREHLGPSIEAHFYYTDYENRLTRILHGTPIFGNFLSHLVFWFGSLYAALDILLRFRPYNCKLFVNPIVGFFYCFLLGLTGRREHIGLAGFLFVHKRSKTYLKFRTWFVNHSCRQASVIVVYSRSEMAEYSRKFPKLSAKFRFVPYGRDFDIFGTRGFEASEPYIAAGGVTNRDFKTLLEALWILSEEKFSVHCKIATRAGLLGTENLPPNVKVLGNVRIDQFGDFLQKASLIVLPLKPTQISGGHMVLLEAMSRGKLAVVADTPGVRDYVGPDSAILYKAGNPVDLARAIRFALEHFDKHEIRTLVRGGQKMYRRCYMHVHLLERLVKELLHSSGGSVKSGKI